MSTVFYQSCKGKLYTNSNNGSTVSPISRAWSTLLKILKGMFTIKSKTIQNQVWGIMRVNETKLYHEEKDDFSYVVHNQL